MTSLLEALNSRRVLLMDGAMGTELQKMGIREEECYENWNLTHAGMVQAIHRAYVAAGAEVLLSNTFQANPASLARHHLPGKLDPLFQAAIANARMASPRFVLADVGPLDCPDRAEVRALVQAAAGADGLLLETQSDGLLLEQVHVVNDLGLPVLISFVFAWSPVFQDLRTMAGLTPEVCAELARDLGASAVGVNCGRDICLKEIEKIVGRFQEATDLPLFARPNAGTPALVEERWEYRLTPAEMAARLPDLLTAGIRLLGGCCGTTPEHIQACRPIVQGWNERK